MNLNMAQLQIVKLKVSKHVTLSKVFQFVDKVFCFLDWICGDKCLYDIDSKCECGDTTFGNDDKKYCCIQMNETCEAQVMFCEATLD